MAGAPLSAVGKALLVAIVWQTVLAVLSRQLEPLWLKSIVGLAAILFPILFAVDVGYRVGLERAAGRPGELPPPQ